MPPRRALAVAGALLVAAAAGDRPAAAAPSGRAAGTSAAARSFRHVATWSSAPWRLRAGAFAYAIDIAHGPDGDRWVLDAVQPAVHRLAPDGRPRAAWPLAGVPASDGASDAVGAERCVPRRLAVGPTGEVAVLTVCTADGGGRRSIVARYDPSGRPTAAFGAPIAYRDLAYARDGRLILARSDPLAPPTPTRGGVERAPGGLDVFRADGRLDITVEGPELVLPIAVDVAPDGRVYVVNWLPYPGAPPAGPEPTPRPSVARRLRRADQTPVEGIVAYDALLRYEGATPFDGADDVAAGRGVYVARADDVFMLGRAEPVWTAPPGALYVPYRHRLVALTAGAGGSLAAALDHCWFQGVVDLGGTAAGGPVAFSGDLDRPLLAGPLAPLRLAAGRSLHVLGARFVPVAGGGRAPVRVVADGDAAPEPQSIVRLDANGAPVDQHGVCGDDLVFTEPRSAANWARDVAAVDDWVFEGGPDIVTAWRGAGKLPVWQLWLGAVDAPISAGRSAGTDGPRPRLAALDARDGRLAILDQGRGAVILVPLARAGDDPAAVAASWPTGPLSGDVPVDIALADDRVYLAYGAARRIAVAALDGRPIDAFDVDDAPLAIAPASVGGAADDILVLGRHGWGLRYTDGRLSARWRMPAPFGAVDISPLPDGRVGVAFLRGPPLAVDDPDGGRAIEEGGVWVFAPADAAPIGPRPPGACLVLPEKSAAPAEVRLAETVTVTLQVLGTCPPSPATTDLALVVDTSRSMSWEGAFERAQAAVLALLGGLDAGRTRVALIAYADKGLVVEPLTGDLGRVGAAMASLAPLGDTRLAPGLEAADRVLQDAAGQAARQALLIVTDGELKDYPQGIARALADRGVATYALAIPLRSYTYGHTRALAGLVGDGHVFVDPDGAAAAAAAAALSAEHEPADLLRPAVITDTLPADMTYVDGSAAPSAEWDAAARTLLWRVAAVPLTATLSLRYAVRPTLVGQRPTNVVARLKGRDGLGRDQELTFPIPSVKVWDRASLTRRVYLPITVRAACLRPPPADIVLALDASRSMDEPAAPLPGTKLDAARAAALSFVERLGAHGARAGLVSFATDAVVDVGLTADAPRLAEAMAGIATAPGTRLDRGLQVAAGLLSREARPGARTAVVLLTDGRASAPDADVLAAAAALTARGAAIYAIALGTDADVELLERAVGASGAVVRAEDAAGVEKAFEAVFERLRCGL